MKKIKSAIMVAIISLAAFSFIIAANAGDIRIQNGYEIEKDSNDNQPLSFMDISFYLYKDEGCGCEPIRDAPIVAYGISTDHNDSGFTDDDGLCILQLEYDHTYRVNIEVEEFQSVHFDFVVIDDQTFKFYLNEKKVSSSLHFPLLETILRIVELNLKNL